MRGLRQSTNDINTNFYWCVREYPTIFVDPCGVIFECAAAVDAASANLLSLQLKFYRRAVALGGLWVLPLSLRTFYRHDHLPQL